MLAREMQEKIKMVAKAKPLAVSIPKGNGRNEQIETPHSHSSCEAAIVSPFSFLSQGLADA